MAKWDQDIHRIQEIQHLLESRQRFFRGQLNTACYKVDKQGNPTYFPSFHSSQNAASTHDNPTEPSIGQSLEANAGSSRSDWKDEGDEYNASSSPRNDDHSDAESRGNDPSEAHCADHSQLDSTPLNSSDEDSKDAGTKAKKKTRKARKYRKWVENNVSKVSESNLERRTYSKKRVSVVGSAPSPSVVTVGSVHRNISFEDNSVAPIEDEHIIDELALINQRKISKTDPIYLLKRKGWLLRNEVARRLDGAGLDIDRKNVLHRVTKGTLAFAREKLKNAEKSLSATVRDEQKKTMKKNAANTDNQLTIRQEFEQSNKAEVTVARKSVSRLALRQAEEALKSDLNLREAFALIKIDPDPLLNLAPLNKDERATAKTVKLSQSDTSEARTRRRSDLSRQRMDFTIFDDPETLRSLSRLTRLSVQHKQKQKSLVPDRINTLPTKTKTSNKSNLETEANTETKIGSRRRSKDLRRNSGPKVAFSNLEAALRAERQGLQSAESHHLVGYRMEKLVGTLL